MNKNLLAVIAVIIVILSAALLFMLGKDIVINDTTTYGNVSDQEVSRVSFQPVSGLTVIDDASYTTAVRISSDEEGTPASVTVIE